MSDAMHAYHRQTDERTDERTDGQTDEIPIAAIVTQ